VVGGTGVRKAVDQFLSAMNGVGLRPAILRAIAMVSFAGVFDSWVTGPSSPPLRAESTRSMNRMRSLDRRT